MVYEDFEEDNLEEDPYARIDKEHPQEENRARRLPRGDPGKPKRTDKRDHSSFSNRLRLILSEKKVTIIILWIVIWLILVIVIGVFMTTFKSFLNKSLGDHGVFYYGATRKTPYIIATLSIVVYIIMQYLKPKSNMDPTRNIEFSDSDVAGSAYFLDERETAEKYNITTADKTDELFFGYMINDDGEVTDLVLSAKKELYLNGHVFICGGSGSRKTTTMLLNMALQAVKRGETIVCTDPKGELYGILKNLLESHGYEVCQFNLNNPFNSDGIDFLEECRDEDLNQMMINCQILADTIMTNTSGLKANEGRGNYWYDNAEAAITGTLYYELMKDGPKATFKDVYRDFQLGAVGFGSLFDKLSNEHPAKKVMAPYLDTLKQGKKENCASILSGVTSRLQIFANPDILEMVSNHDMDFSRAGKKKCAFFVMAPDQHKTMTFLNSTYFAMMFIKLARLADQNETEDEEGKLPVRVNFLLDEFKSVGHINGFEDKLANIRSRNITLTVVMQSIAQLEVMYPGVSWEDALSNFDVNIYLGGNDSEESARYYANRLGDASAIDTQVRHNESLTTPIMNKIHPQTMVGESVKSRKLMSPDEIVADLPLDQAILFVKHTRPCKIGKFLYKQHPMAKEINRINASSHVPKWVRLSKGYPLDASDVIVSKTHKAIRLIWRKTGKTYSYDEYMEALEHGTLPNVSEDDPDVVNIYGFVSDSGVTTAGSETDNLLQKLQNLGDPGSNKRLDDLKKALKLNNMDDEPDEDEYEDEGDDEISHDESGPSAENEEEQAPVKTKTKNGALMAKLKKKTNSIAPDDL